MTRAPPASRATALHRDCVRSLGGCPTIGCTLRLKPPAPRPPVHDRLEALIFWVPAVLTFLWPVTFIAGVLLRDALGLDGHVFIGPSLDYMGLILLFALGLGPAVGHLILAPMAAPGGHHRRATRGAATGFGVSLLVGLAIGLVSYMTAAFG